MSGRTRSDGHGPGLRAQLPLLDRLIDDAPDQQRDTALSSAEAMAMLRRSVRRDLEALLNARRRWRSWPAALTQLDVSPLGFGIPDFTSGAFNDTGRREQLRGEIETIIRRFEPRFASVRVTLLEGGTLEATLRLRIEALLHAEPAPEPVAFDTLVDATTADVFLTPRDDVDLLLPYFNRELVAIRRLAAEFAEAHPKIAGRLRLSADAVDDPHVARLLDGVAFLAARVHHRLDDEFPELTDALLGVLYPHYLAPVPSCAVVQFHCQADLEGAYRVASGVALDTEPVRGDSCRFRTAYPLTLWPIEIDTVRLSGLPLTAPVNPAASGALAVLRIGLKCVSPTGSFAQLGLDRLRFFLRGAANLSLPLYELLCEHTVSVAYADGPADPAPVIVGRDAITAVGFAPEEALLPWPARSFSGFRLLSEYFAFPEKFLFLDFLGLDGKTLLSGGNRMEIFVYLDRAVPELERALGADALALGCTPAVNLFPQRCEPLSLTGAETEYRIVPDVRRPAALEVWGVERVRETQPDGSSRPWRPFYRLTHGDPDAGVPGGFYHVTRRDTAAPLTGSEVYLAPHDPAFDTGRPGEPVLSIDAICLNRDLPADLPFGGGHPRVQLVEGEAAVTRVVCLTAPTPTLRAPLRERGFWRLVSHLSLGHLSVAGGEDGARALKEILRLYDLRDSAETRTAIEALQSVTARPGTARVPGARAGAFCRGLDVTLEFDARSWQVGGLYLLASVLDRFLALHATVNSFVRTGAVLRGRPGRAAGWPARAGARVLL